MNVAGLSSEELNKLYRKHKITARKAGGDDQYSWAVFRNGRVTYNGLSQREVSYYKRRVLEMI